MVYNMYSPLNIFSYNYVYLRLWYLDDLADATRLAASVARGPVLMFPALAMHFDRIRCDGAINQTATLHSGWTLEIPILGIISQLLPWCSLSTDFPYDARPSTHGFAVSTNPHYTHIQLSASDESRLDDALT